MSSRLSEGTAGEPDAMGESVIDKVLWFRCWTFFGRDVFRRDEVIGEGEGEVVEVGFGERLQGWLGGWASAGRLMKVAVPIVTV